MFDFIMNENKYVNTVKNNYSEAEALRVFNHNIIGSGRKATITFFTSHVDGHEYVSAKNGHCTGVSLVSTEKRVGPFIQWALLGGEPVEMPSLDDEGDEVKYTDNAQYELFSMLIKAKKNIQLVPAMRSGDKVVGVFNGLNAKIIFRLDRTPDLEKFLEEHGYAC